MSAKGRWLLVTAIAGVGGLLAATGSTFLTSLPPWAVTLSVVAGAILATVAGTIATRRPHASTTAPEVEVPKVWTLPSRLAQFTGRTSELTQIEECHRRGRQPDIAIVWGIGGIGKTSVALEYAHQIQPDRELVVWITATDRVSVKAGLAELGAELGITGGDQATVLRRTLSALDRRAPWLLVYDDATPEAVQGLLPVTGDGDVLITSRDGDWADVGQPIEIKSMPEDDAVALLLNRSQDRSPDAARHAHDLALRLGLLPLALDLASAYCYNTCTIAEYRQLLDRAGLELLRRRRTDNGRNAGVNEIAARLSADRITGRDTAARQLLRLLAWFAPGYVPRSVLTGHALLLPQQLRRAAADGRVWHTQVNRLHAAGLIRAESGLVWSHQLVQEVQRDRITERTTTWTRHLRRAAACVAGDPTRGWTPQTWKGLALRLIAADFPNSWNNPSVWPHCTALLPHATALLDDLHLPQAHVSTLAHDVFNFYLTTGQHTSAAVLGQQTLGLRHGVLGREHPDTLASMNNLANALYAMGDYAAACHLYRQTLDLRQRILGDQHPHTLTSMNNLANALNRLGEHESARDLHQQTLNLRQRILGDEHPDTLASMSNLANALNRLGEHQSVRDLHRPTLDLRRRILGDQHPDTLTSMNNLANALDAMGDYAAARDLHQQTLDLRRRILGDEHPDTLASMNNLANALDAMVDYAAARDLHEEALDLRRRVLGDQHPDTLGSMNNLANVRNRLGEHKAARDLHQQTLDLRRKILGDQHPDTLTSMNNLANALNRLGEHAAARDLYQETLNLRRQILGDQHPHTLTSMNNLANALNRLGEHESARDLHQQTLNLRQRILGDQHPDTLASMSNLANALDKLGEHTSARELYRPTLDLRRRILGDQHPDTLTSMNNLANTLYAVGDYAAARDLHEEALDLRRRILGDQHPDTLTSMNNLANVRNRLGEHKAARDLHQQTLDLRRKILGDQHPDTLTSMNNLANALNRLGEHAAARDLYQETLNLRRRLRERSTLPPP